MSVKLALGWHEEEGYMGWTRSTHRENEKSYIFHEVSSFRRDKYLAIIIIIIIILIIGPSRHSRMSVEFNHLSQHNNPEPKVPLVGLRIILKEVVNTL
jgi:hypothetical protein